MELTTTDKISQTGGERYSNGRSNFRRLANLLKNGAGVELDANEDERRIQAHMFDSRNIGVKAAMRQVSVVA